MIVSEGDTTSALPNPRQAAEVGIFAWWRDRRVSAQLDRLAEAVRSGTALIADATAYEAVGDQAAIPGVVECWDDILQFKANTELPSWTEGWRIPQSQIEDVRAGEQPGELVITFRTPTRFRAIAVTPLLHAEKWRGLVAP